MSANVYTRTPEETAANNARLAAPASVPTAPPVPAVVAIVQDPQRMKALEVAAAILYPTGGELAVVRLALCDSGVPAPAAADPAGFVQGLLRLGFRPIPTCLAQPLAGSLYVECDENREPVRVGIVAKVLVDKGTGAIQRDRFYRAATEDREVAFSRVEFFLLNPQGCPACGQRKG